MKIDKQLIKDGVNEVLQLISKFGTDGGHQLLVARLAYLHVRRCLVEDNNETIVRQVEDLVFLDDGTTMGEA
jgi:hypothetical protein